MAAVDEGRHEEGLALLRNALVAAELNELDDANYELIALDGLTEALCKAHAIDEVEPLVLRYREAAKAQSEKKGFCFKEIDSRLCSARLHEVLCICTPRLGTPSHGSALASCTAMVRALFDCLLFAEFNFFLFSALLHEVLCICTPCLGTPSHCCTFAYSTANSHLPQGYPRLIEAPCTC